MSVLGVIFFYEQVDRFIHECLKEGKKVSILIAQNAHRPDRKHTHDLPRWKLKEVLGISRSQFCHL